MQEKIIMYLSLWLNLLFLMEWLERKFAKEARPKKEEKRNKLRSDGDPKKAIYNPKQHRRR